MKYYWVGESNVETASPINYENGSQTNRVHGKQLELVPTV